MLALNTTFPSSSLYASNTTWFVPSLKYTRPLFIQSNNKSIISSLSKAILSTEVCLAIRILS